MEQYTHVIIDKNNVGLDTLRAQIDQNGLRTAESLGIALDSGSVKLGHHRHVFMWDSSQKGVKGRMGLMDRNNNDRFLVRICGTHLLRSGTISASIGAVFRQTGILKGDNGELGGPSTNGAWAHEGNIPRKFCFIEGLDSESRPGFSDWASGNGWPG